MSNVVWTVAGFDPSSGAGVTADLMTFAAHGLFGCSAITALTVQSTQGVAGTEAIAPELLRATLNHLSLDLPPAGVKIGMLGTVAVASQLGAFLQGSKSVVGRSYPVVLDPVLRSSSGRELFAADGFPALAAELLPWVDWITPNWSELELLTGVPVRSVEGAGAAAGTLQHRHPNLNVVVTGGDQERPVELLLTVDGRRSAIAGEHIQTSATHGTGCAFSAALLCALVLGAEGEGAVQRAKRFVEGALRNAPRIGHGRGPLGLLWPLTTVRSSDGGHEGTA